jgi:hypothetical protein
MEAWKMTAQEQIKALRAKLYEEIKTDVLKGLLTYAQIARKHGVHINTVMRITDVFGIKRRSAKAAGEEGQANG